MKTNLRWMPLSAGLMSLWLCAGCDQQSAQAQDVPAKTDSRPPVIPAADEPKPADARPEEAKPAEPAAPSPVSLEAPAATDAADANPVQNPTAPPDQLKLAPALADVIKLVQAGVGEEVLMTYITNSTDFFNIGPNEILYLHDLGVPGPIITSLIHQDATPMAMARKQAVNAVQPLPPGVALNKPATNIFTPKMGAVPVAVAPETAEAVTNEPPVDAAPAPEVVYTVPTEVQQPVNVSYFYTELAPYGTWVDYPGYGRCWRPTVSVWNSAWRPYCDGGRWLWSDCGWYWYSDYTWGASVFHYGRWTCPPGRGWLWVPDTCWGPSWVSWRHTRSYCAWAPLPPSAKYVTGHGWYHNTLSVGADHEFGLKKDAYVALPKDHMLARRPSSHYLSPRHTESVINDSSVANHYATVNKTVMNRGIGVDSISRAGGNIRPVSIRSADTVGPSSPRRELLAQDGRTLVVARPATVAPAIAPPTKPISALSNQRVASGRPSAVTSPQAPVVNATANNTVQNRTPNVPGGATVIPSGRAAAPIIMRGNGRVAGGSSATSVAGQSVTVRPDLTPDSVNKPSANHNTGSQRAALPGGRNPGPRKVEHQRTSGQPVVARPAPTAPAAVTAPARTTVARAERTIIISQPAVQRAPSSPVPVQMRVAPSAPSSGPVYRTAPSAPVAATVLPRVESYRAPGPASVPRVSAPVQSSGGGSGLSRSSGSGSGSQRGSR